MLNKLKEIRNTSNEEGFTLIELMIVVVIIGILAAIAIPIFMNQQKSAIAAGVKSDVKNTVTEVGVTLTENPTATELSSSVTPVVSEGTTVIVSGSWDNYTVRGTNAEAEACYEFSSTTGKTTECVAVEEGENGSGLTGLAAQAAINLSRQYHTCLQTIPEADRTNPSSVAKLECGNAVGFTGVINPDTGYPQLSVNRINFEDGGYVRGLGSNVSSDTITGCLSSYEPQPNGTTLGSTYCNGELESSFTF